MKILICEDNKIALKTTSAILNREGFKTDFAGDGNVARSKLEQETYDLILIDIHLPFHSGLELVKYLRSDLGKKTPVIILTAFSDPQMQKQARELGINEYIIKPYNPSFLVSKIREALNNN
jgi:DNA-binding response OmpR family regulator